MIIKNEYATHSQKNTLNSFAISSESFNSQPFMVNDEEKSDLCLPLSSASLIHVVPHIFLYNFSG